MVEIDFDLYRKYLPYIAEAMMRNGVMANDIEQIYAQSEANYCRTSKPKQSIERQIRNIKAA